MGYRVKGGHINLYTCHYLSEAQRFIERYTRWGDWGGYKSLSIWQGNVLVKRYYPNGDD